MDVQEEVFRQLRKTRQAGLSRLDDPKYADLQVSYLQAAAKKVPGYDSNSTKGGAVTRLIEYEVPRVKAPGHAKWLTIVFGLRPDLAGLPPDELRTEAAKEAKDTRNNFARKGGREWQALQSLAAQIVADSLVSNASDSSEKDEAQESSALDADYVHRDEIERQFKELVERGAKLIALVGFPGMGKTTIAETLASPNAFIEFENGEPYIADLQPAIDRYCPDSQGIVAVGNILPLLARLLSAVPSPRVVVLDNLQSTNELRRLVPRETTAVVLATCRETGPDAPSWCKEIRVGAMTEDEAAQLAESKHGSLSHRDARFVANSLGQYPLLISLACRLANVTGLNIRTLCGGLQIDPGDATLRADEKLRDVVTRAISFLRETEGVAVDFLTCLSHAPLLTVEHLRHLVQSIYRDDAAGVRCANAVSLLRDLMLIEPFSVCFGSDRGPDGKSSTGVDVFNDSIQFAAQMSGVLLDEEGVATFIRIHPHVRSLLKKLLKEDAFRTYYRVLAHLMVWLTNEVAAASELDRQSVRDDSSSSPAALTAIGRALQDVVHGRVEESEKMRADENKSYYEVLAAKVKNHMGEKESEGMLEGALETFTEVAGEEHKGRFLHAGFLNGMLSSLGKPVPDSEVLLKDLYAGEI